MTPGTASVSPAATCAGRAARQKFPHGASPGPNGKVLLEGSHAIFSLTFIFAIRIHKKQDAVERSRRERKSEFE
jgi:hypothetical protein